MSASACTRSMPSLFSTTQEFVVNNEGWRSIRPKYKQLTYFFMFGELKLESNVSHC